MFTLYMHTFTAVVKKKIGYLLSEQFAVFFGGLAREYIQYVFIFTTYSANNCLNFSEHVFWFSLISSKATFDTTEHYDYVKYVPSVYENTFANVVAIIDKNTA